MKKIGLIPSRLESTRLPNKALLDIDGLPMIVHVYKRTCLSKQLDDVYVCTDNDEIESVVKNSGGKVIRTSSHHLNGTERIAEAVNNLNADLFVNIQGDEPLINPANIDSVVEFHKKNLKFDIILPTIPTTDGFNRNVVKVVTGNNSNVLYLSRCPIPYGSKFFLKHLSIISFIPESLQKFSNYSSSKNEILENVELMRALDNQMSVGTLELDGDSFSVDVMEDYYKSVEKMKTDTIKYFYTTS